MSEDKNQPNLVINFVEETEYDHYIPIRNRLCSDCRVREPVVAIVRGASGHALICYECLDEE